MPQAIGPERIEQLGRRDREADEQEDDRRQQVGDELPDRVDRIRAVLGPLTRRAEVAEDDRRRSPWR